MAKQLSWDDMDAYEQSDRVPFFNLENDGDKAVVRFMHTDDDIEKFAIHRVKQGEKTYKIACLRGPSDPVSDCPLCDEGEFCSSRMFLKVLVYTPDKDGYYTNPGVLHVWERGKGFRKKIQSLINRYVTENTPLYETVFEIERCGKKGDTKTTYEVYKMENLDEDECPLPDMDEINEFSALGTIVYDKTEEEILYFLENGEFPRKEEKRGNRGGRQPVREEKPVRNGLRNSVKNEPPKRNLRVEQESEEEDDLVSETEYDVDEEEEQVSPKLTGRRTATGNPRRNRF